VVAPKNKRFVKIFVIIVAPLFILSIGNRLVAGLQVPPEQKIQRAEFLIKEKDYAAAMVKVQELREDLPGDVKSWLLEADIYEKQGKIEEAIKAYQEAAKIKSSDLHLQQRLANLYTRTKRFDEAEKVLLKVKEIRPDYLSEYDLGLLYIKMNKFDVAQAQFETSKKLNPFFPEVHRNLGLLERQNGNFSAAKESLDKYLKMKPNAPDRDAILLWMKQNSAAFESQESNSDSELGE